MHYLIGDFGHLLVISSFVTSLVSAFAYLMAMRGKEPRLVLEWLRNARVAFYVHCLSVVGIVVILYTIISRHYFEYHYAYAHSSLHLPAQYMISCFWEGQEGSFLLWMFWQAVLGLIMIITQRSWEAPMMVVFTLVQAFLATMILGVVIPAIQVKVGSSPFILLRDALIDPIFKTQPDFIPKDGNGLNPLLQNYWMVIHPPTLFLGFALTLIPFAFCMAGLWQQKYSEWIRPALPWALVGGGILGIGILMGGYWAYETLSFGGYWNWDPVENAVYVPWLVQIASIHTMMSHKRSGTAVKSSMVLVTAVFILILYSTFLTRSGILGDASVHSFTDLGLSGQLLIYLLFFTVFAVALSAARWKKIPDTDQDAGVYSREFWIFLGAITLCLMGFQVLIPTSFPVYNKIMEGIGISSSVAPPADQISFYSHWQIWFAAAVALVSGTGQFFWWKKLSRSSILKELTVPVLISLVVWAILLIVAQLKPLFLVLSFAAIYIIVANLTVVITILKGNARLSGGAVAHVGLGLMLIGILFSAGYSKIVSLNNTGLLYLKDAGTEFNRDNLLLFINERRTMADYDIEFRGEYYELRRKSGYVKKSYVEPTNDPYLVVANRDVIYNNRKLYSAGDTLEIYPENSFYKIELSKNNKIAATLYPRVQINPAMGGFIASPDITHNLTSDLYTHVSAPMDASAEVEWGKTEEVRIHQGEKFFINDYVSTLEGVQRVEQIAGMRLQPEDVAVKARVRIEGEHETYYAEPIFLIRGRSEVGLIPSIIDDLGVRVILSKIQPETQEFTFSLSAHQKNWVIIKAMEKPFINILWIGTVVLMAGFFLAARRRFLDFRNAPEA